MTKGKLYKFFSSVPNFLEKLWCKRFGHFIKVSSNGGILVEHKCLLCGYFVRTFMGLNPKLKFVRFAHYKTDNFTEAIRDITL